MKHREKENMATIVSDDYKKIKNADASAYITLPWMTKYEFDQLIGLRTMHLSKGATPFVDIPDNFKINGNMELRAIALQEIQAGRLPYTIKRPLPNGTSEYWPVSTLSLEAVKYMMR
jgi:DNA-directed RNA polymerase I, II, and III subunit RPABC2